MPLEVGKGFQILVKLVGNAEKNNLKHKVKKHPDFPLHQFNILIYENLIYICILFNYTS